CQKTQTLLLRSPTRRLRRTSRRFRASGRLGRSTTRSGLAGFGPFFGLDLLLFLERQLQHADLGEAEDLVPVLELLGRDQLFDPFRTGKDIPILNAAPLHLQTLVDGHDSAISRPKRPSRACKLASGCALTNRPV